MARTLVYRGKTVNFSKSDPRIKRQMIDREDFDLWRDHPVTVHVFKELKKVADVAKDEWVAASWGQGKTDPVLLADLRARAEVVNDLITVSYEDIDDSSSEAKADAKG